MDEFGTSLQNSLSSVLTSLENLQADDEEELLFQWHRIDELLIVLNNLTANVDLGISTEDVSYISALIGVFDDLRKKLIYAHRRKPADSTRCTMMNTSTTNNGKPGRPKFLLRKDVLEELRGLGFSWTKIAEILNVSRWTVNRRVEEFELTDLKRFSDISDHEVDRIIKDYISRHGATTGYRFIAGLFHSKGIKIQRRRIRESLNRVDPDNVFSRWGAVICRRTYYVPWPNSLWHIDGHHSLIRWKFVLHGCIDGKSRKIMFLHCSANNLAETVRTLFLDAIQEHGNSWPSRIRVDFGVENVSVCDEMVAKRGPDRNSFLAGPSTRNQRIERLWRDVFRCVTAIFYYTFYAMEQKGILDIENEVHLFILHLVYLPRINHCIAEFKALYNDHKLSSERNWTPNQIWVNGMINPENPLSSDLLGEDETDEYYGEDPNGPLPFSEENNIIVESPHPEIENLEAWEAMINGRVDANRNSDQMGIDIYMEAMDILQNEAFLEQM